MPGSLRGEGNLKEEVEEIRNFVDVRWSIPESMIERFGSMVKSGNLLGYGCTEPYEEMLQC